MPHTLRSSLERYVEDEFVNEDRQVGGRFSVTATTPREAVEQEAAELTRTPTS